MNSIRGKWDAYYQDAILRSGAGPVLAQWARLAFYAGAFNLLVILRDSGIDRLDMEKVILDLVNECLEFSRTAPAETQEAVQYRGFIN